MPPVHQRRPTTDELFIQMARSVAQRSTCARAQVGAIVTDALGLQILGYGYNGAPRGFPNRCARDVPGNCGCVHAELNALLKAPGTVPGKRLYTTMAPCEACARAIVNAQIVRVIYALDYRDTSGLDVLRAAGIALVQCRGFA